MKVIIILFIVVIIVLIYHIHLKDPENKYSAGSNPDTSLDTGNNFSYTGSSGSTRNRRNNRSSVEDGNDSNIDINNTISTDVNFNERKYLNKNIPRNPILKYQYDYTRGRNPIILDDPIIPPMYTGPLVTAYNYNEGPYIGKPLNVPVPQGSLKTTSEKWKAPFYYSQRPLPPYDYFKPYGPNPQGYSLGAGYADDPYYTKGNSLYFGDVPFIGSVNAYAPFAEVHTNWEKAGILTRLDNN